MLEALNSPWVFGSIASICIAVIILAFRYKSIIIEKLGFSAGNKKVKQSVHSHCPHSKDIMELVHRTADHYEKIQDLKSSIIKEQMRYYEEIEEETVGQIKHFFTKLLTAKLPENEQFINHDDYVYFSLLIKVIFTDIKSYIRNCFSANHYITYSIEAQQDYVDKKTIVILQNAIETLNDCWRGSIITRTMLYNDFKVNTDFYKKQVETIFNRAFSVTRSTYKEIEKAEKEYQRYINDVVGPTEDK